MLKMIFGSRNDRIVKKYLKRVKDINKLESKYEKLTDNELKEAFNRLKANVKSGDKSLDEALNDSFAITREASKRVLNMRHFDVQIVGGMVLHDGAIAEMKTGEGKTLVATLAVSLNAMLGEGVHVVTVNDYLAKETLEIWENYTTSWGNSVGVLTEDIYDEETKKVI